MMIDNHHQLVTAMCHRGWFECAENQLCHPSLPDLQYIVFPYWGVIEQKRIKGLWWAGRGWTFGRMAIDKQGNLTRNA